MWEVALAPRHHHFGTHVALAATFALLSALAFAVASVAQQRAAARVSDEQARSGSFITELVKSPQWWAGTLGNGGGYVLQGVALAFGSLLVVQPLIVTSLLFALPLGARLARRRLPRAVIAWGVVLAVALAVFVTVGNPNNGRDRATHHGWLIVTAIGLPIVILCVVVAHGRSGAARASLLAVGVGLLAGVLAVLTKGVVGLIQHHPGHLLLSGETYALLAVGAAGIYLQQLAFQAGALQASLPVILVLEPVVAGVLGLSLLHEQMRVTGGRMALLVVVVIAMTLATVALARGEAHLEEPGHPDSETAEIGEQR
ncbi:MAG: DMT family transporter [Actinobacteria bacterium]|nr:DMT family transporter [Actinomycetota bacterium]